MRVLLLSLALILAGCSPNYDQMKESTVLIEVVGPNGKVASHASGVLIDDNTILTAGHVTTGINSEIDARVTFYDGEEVELTVKKENYDAEPRTRVLRQDLALVTVEKDFDYPEADISCKEQPVGEPVYIVGSPGSTRWTVTQGQVMGGWRENYKKEDWLAVDATTVSGSSGGPIFNTRGQIIGVVSHGYTKSRIPVGLNYGVSGPTICEFLNERRNRTSNRGERPN